MTNPHLNTDRHPIDDETYIGECRERLDRDRSNGEIAIELYLSEATLKTHVSRVVRKLEVRDRVQAVIAAFAAGLA